MTRQAAPGVFHESKSDLSGCLTVAPFSQAVNLSLISPGARDISNTYLFAPFCLAHLFFCAAEIFARASALSAHFALLRPPRFGPVLVPANKARPWLRREISASIWDSRSEIFMRNSVARRIMGCIRHCRRSGAA